MPERDKKKISINANPTGTLEIEEFKGRMAKQVKEQRLKRRSREK